MSNRELEADLFRRSTEREKAEVKARAAAAIEAQEQADADRRMLNDAIRGGRPASQEPGEPPPARPSGEADGGKGEPEEIEFDYTRDGQWFRVFTDRELFGEHDDQKGT